MTDQEQDDWMKALLEPLRAESSEVFVQNVMRKVRVYEVKEGWIRWPVFARWAWPALALSAASFMATMAYTVKPLHVSTDVLLLGDRDQNVSTEWLSNPPNEDQILDSVVKQ